MTATSRQQTKLYQGRITRSELTRQDQPPPLLEGPSISLPGLFRGQASSMASSMALARHQFARLDGLCVDRLRPSRWSRGTPAFLENIQLLPEIPENQAGEALALRAQPDLLQDQVAKLLAQPDVLAKAQPDLPVLREKSYSGRT